MTFDNIEELHKIKKVNEKAELVLRIYAKDKKAKFNLSNKYGAHSEEWPKLYKTAKELGLNIMGICFHIGSGAEDNSIYIDAIEKAKNCKDLGEKYGYKFSLIDIGGGFSFKKLEPFSEAINLAKNKYFKDKEIKFIAEPGRYFAETSVLLYTLVF